MRARALEFHAPGVVRVVDVGVADPERGKVLVRTEYSGVSGGTELLAYRGEIDPHLALDEAIGSLGGTFAFPFRYGYSCVGVVERSLDPAIPEGSRVFAFHPHQDRFVVAADDVVEIAGGDPRTATLFPLVETALQVGLDAGPRLGETVIVTGLGVVGILAGAMLSRAGARVIGSDPLAWRREAAKPFGIDAVSPPELRASIEDATGGAGVSLVVEASGRPEVLDGALALLAHEGEALVCSWYGTKPVPLTLGGAFHRRRLTIRSTQVSSIPAAQRSRWDRRSRRDAARRLLSELPLEALATHEFPFDQAAQAFDAIDRGADGLLHAALRYR
ncbi:MAG: zinc-binding alcohol dehydrogenase [Actinomycetota bacterium]